MKKTTKTVPFDETLEDFSPLKFKRNQMRRAKLDVLQRSKIISANNPLRIRWDLFIMFLALYNCFSVPYTISFFPGYRFEVLQIFLDFAVDMLFTVDIYFNCRTSIIDLSTGEELICPSEIFRHYAKSGRFFIDLLACFPIGLFELMFELDSSYSLIKLLKLVRVMRLSSFIHHLRIQQDIKVPLRIGRLILYILIYLHLLACAWRFVISIERTWTPPNASINPSYDFYSESHYNQYSKCLYLALGTLIGVEGMPSSNLTMVFCMVFIIVGALVSTYMLGEITLLVSNIRAGIRDFSSTMDSLASTMIYLKIDTALQFEISDFFKQSYYLFKRNQSWREFRLVLPKSLKIEINTILYTKTLLTQPVFAISNSQGEQLISKLNLKFNMPSETVIAMGDESEEFFIVVDGNFEVTVEGLDGLDYTVRKLESSEYFGEIGIIYNVKRTASVFALNYSSVGTLHRLDFLDILTSDRDLEEALKENIANYNDPYRVSVLAMMRKVCYFNNLDSISLDYLLYSLRVEQFDEETIVFEEGAICNKLYFIIKGSLLIYVNLYDFDLRKRLNYRRSIGTVFAKQRSYATSEKRKMRKYSIKKILNPTKKAHLKLCKLGPGSIVCASQMLLDKKFKIHSFTSEDTVMLILDQEKLQSLMPANTRLRIAVNTVKNKHKDYPPEFDCYKKFINEVPGIKEYWRNIRKWKNAVLTIIMNNRHKRMTRFNFNSFLPKLKAILKSEKIEWKWLTKKLESYEVPFSVMKIAAFLNRDDIGLPIMRQFGAFAKELNENAISNGEYIRLIRKNIVKLKKRRKIALVKTNEVRDIVILFSNYFG